MQKELSGRGQDVLIMGIVNVTPDSFSDGGQFFRPDDALHHAYRLMDEGADILDLGAESTRPTAQPVSEEEEWRRLEPVLKDLCKNNCPIPISIDTYKAGVAAKALEYGATIINDVWGGLADERMHPLVAGADCEYIWMHNRHRPVSSRAYDALWEETLTGIEACLEAGIQVHRLWIDPGIGFGKTHAQNLSILQRLNEYCSALSYPVLLGTSRKSVVGNTLNLPESERLEGTLATAVLGVQAGVRCLRVHDVRATKRAVVMAQAILQAGADA